MEDFGNCEEFLKNSDHNKIIIHIDIDCFYAQVEVLKNPSLHNKPVGIKQKNYVITSNYIARAYGIKKCMFITEALQLCPGLILINGEDLHDYKLVSSDVTNIIKTFSDKVEKLGLDENFIDATNIVYNRMIDRREVYKIEGHIYNNVIETECNCGCAERLTVGSIIAKEIRDKIKNQLGLTCCAGISYNKLLAKLVTSINKPNQQTVVFPSSAVSLMQNLGAVGQIPGIGIKMTEILNSLGIFCVTDLQNFPLRKLEKQLLKNGALKLKKASYGIDDDDVKTSGKPQSISVEDACKKLSSLGEVAIKLKSLVQRLIVLIKEDGRQPTTARITIRKYNQCDRQQTRESKQCSVSVEWFSKPEYFTDNIVKFFLQLFQKLVDTSKPFHLTLIGITVTKFLDISQKKSILDFIQKMQVTEDNKGKLILSQECEKSHELSVLSEENVQLLASSSTQKILSSQYTAIDKSSVANKCPEGIDKRIFCELPNDIQDELLMYSRSFLQHDDKMTGTSKPQECLFPEQKVNMPSSKQCPEEVDEHVFSQLPSDIQCELIVHSNSCHKKLLKKSKQKSIESYFSKESGNLL